MLLSGSLSTFNLQPHLLPLLPLCVLCVLCGENSFLISPPATRHLSSMPFVFNHFRTLLRLSKTQPFCFQSIPHSLRKTPGVGVHLTLSRRTTMTPKAANTAVPFAARSKAHPSLRSGRHRGGGARRRECSRRCWRKSGTVFRGLGDPNGRVGRRLRRWTDKSRGARWKETVRGAPRHTSEGTR
jgi:hypothetical protein